MSGPKDPEKPGEVPAGFVVFHTKEGHTMVPADGDGDVTVHPPVTPIPKEAHKPKPSEKS